MIIPQNCDSCLVSVYIASIHFIIFTMIRCQYESTVWIITTIQRPKFFREGTNNSQFTSFLYATRSKRFSWEDQLLIYSLQKFTADPVLTTFYKLLTVSADLDNKIFVSAIESKSSFPRIHHSISSSLSGHRYPFFGVQWHPEKNGFEWRVNSSYPHGRDAIQVAEYLSNFFANQVRQNPNHFDSLVDEVKYSIYQYNPEFMGLDQSRFQQLYFFQE